MKEDQSYLIKEIIGITPRWIFRWGITIIFMVLFLTVTILSIIQYPVKMTIISSLQFQKTPIPISLNNSNIFKKALVKNRGSVFEGQPIFEVMSLNPRLMNTVRSPVNGFVFFPDTISENSYLDQSRPICLIFSLPNKKVIKLELPSKLVSSIRRRQDILIRLDNRDSATQVLKAKVGYIGPSRPNGNCSVTLLLVDDMGKEMSINSADDLNLPRCRVEITIAHKSYIRHLLHL